MLIKCNQCFNTFDVEADSIFFDESGFGYSTKLVKCKHCGKIHILEYIEDKSLDINHDLRFYTYSFD